jgi:hypothetical protein
MATTNAYHAGVVELLGHALSLIRLDRQVLGNGVDGHVSLDAVAREVADRP